MADKPQDDGVWSVDDDLKVIVQDDVETIRVDPITGTVEEDQPDGSVRVLLDAKKQDDDDDRADKWFANLIDKLDAVELGKIANDLIEGIQADDASRQESLANHQRGLDLLGLKLDEPKGESEDGGPVSSVTNPLLLEACIKSWANAQAEMLPADGPVKVKVDVDANVERDTLAEKLEQGFNHYLTTTASEYYPDTSYMLLWGPIFKGSGFKKVYRCPMRRRPVSESVDAKDLIMSDTTKDFYSCGRITHEISMRPSMFKRMVAIGAYNDVNLTPPNPTANPVDEAIAGIQGTSAIPSRPEDKPYTIWETQCELDLDEFVPKSSPLKGKGIPLPYLVAINKDDQQVLAIRRDWDEDDENCHRLRMYVKYPYIPGPGAYGTGLLNLLGNSSAAMTGAWRLALDCGMYSNFPGGLIAKSGARQDTNNFHPAPGEFAQVDTGGMPVRDAVMSLPYKDVTPGLMALIDKITEQSKQMGSQVEIPVGEGVKDIPVGTMLATVEQATKIMAAVHKGWHKAQSEEFELFIELFKRNPEDFWRDNKDQKDYWTEQQLLKAFEDKNIRPASDPNVPSHIHRLAKVLALIQLMQVFPELRRERILRRALAVLHEDFDDLVDPNYQPSAGADPMAQAKMVEAQAKMAGAQGQIMKAKTSTDDIQLKTAAKAAEMASKERQHEAEIQKELIIHDQDAEKVAMQERRNELMAQNKMQFEDIKHQHDIEHEDRKLHHNEVAAEREHSLKVQQAGIAAEQADREHGLNKAAHALEVERAAHEAAVNVHTALNPPKPAKASVKAKK